MEGICNEIIYLVEMNGNAFVWNSKDWLKLRRLRIVGNFVGNLATLSKQDRIAALPLALLKEETTLLLEKGLAVLKSYRRLSEPPNNELYQKSKEWRNIFLIEQAEVLKESRKEEIISKIDVIMKGKKLKMKDVATINYEVVSEENEKIRIFEEESQKAKIIENSTLAIQLCTSDPWLQLSDLESIDWSCSKDNLNYLVYRDLWERGYYITLGDKFGGDFLVYPGDPIRYHAFFIVICLEKKKELQMQDIISYGRLGNSVKKTVVLAYLDSKNHVSYNSVQWSGF